jgi:type IV secretion system protein VirD4
MEPTDFLKTILSESASLGEMALHSVRDNIRYGIENLNAKPKKLYDASFGDPGEVLSPTNTGFVIDGRASLTRKISNMNLAVIGQTGCGKTSTQIIPNCLHSDNCSAVIHDPGGSVITATGYDFLDKEMEPFVFDPNNPNGSVEINFFDFIKTQSHISKISTHLIKSSYGEKSSDKFWEYATISACNVFISLTLLLPKEFRNAANLKHLVDSFAGGGAKLLNPLAAKAPEKVYSQYRALIAGPEKTLKSVVMSLSAALSLWESEDICKVTARTSIDFTKFRKNKSVLFLKNSTFQAGYIKPLMSLIIEEMFEEFMREIPEPGDLPISVCIDECATLRLDSLSQIISNSRKYNICNMLVFQNVSQIYNNFGHDDASTILANCHNKIYYGGCDMRTAQDLCELFGKRLVKDHTGKEIVANLMEASDIRMLSPKEIIFTCGAHRPFKLPVTPFYALPKLRKRTERPYEYHNPNPIKSVPLFPLE